MTTPGEDKESPTAQIMRDISPELRERLVAVIVYELRQATASLSSEQIAAVVAARQAALRRMIEQRRAGS